MHVSCDALPHHWLTRQHSEGMSLPRHKSASGAANVSSHASQCIAVQLMAASERCHPPGLVHTNVEMSAHHLSSRCAGAGCAWGQHDGRVRRRRVAVLGYPRANPYLIEGYAACSSSCACCSCGPLLIGTSLHRSPSSSVPGAGSLPSSSPRDLSAIETSSQTPICHRNRSSCGRGTTS